MPTSPRTSHVCAVTAALMLAGATLAQQFEVLRETVIRGDVRALINDGVMADVDGNGTIDILLRSGSLLVNDGKLGFDWSEPGTRIPLNAFQMGTRFHEVADINGDGHLDLVQSALSFSPAQGEFNVMFGAASGLWGSPQLLATISGFSTLRAVHDVNADGAPDLICSDSANVHLLLNNGGMNGFTDVSATHMPAVAIGSPAVVDDFDGDGDLDIVTARIGNAMQLLLNDGTGQFSIQASSGLPTYPGQYSVRGGDADGDGDVDLVVRSAQFVNFLLLENDGSGAFSAGPGTLPPASSEFAFDDIDGDGDADLLVVDSFGAQRELRPYRNQSPGVFTALSGVVIEDFQGLGDPVLVDLDGDGDRDVVVGGAHLFLDDGTQNYSALQRPAIPRAYNVGTVLPADLDGDDDIDLVLGAQIMINQGGGFFALQQLQQLPSGVLARALADIDNDGDLDVIYTEDPSFGPSIGGGTMRNQNGILQFGMQFPAGQLVGDVIAADFDQDGLVDLYSEGGIVLQNTGAGVFVAVAGPAISVGNKAAAGDCNGDGLIDLVVGDSQGWSVWQNVGGLTFQQVASHMSPTPSAIAVGDLDGDGQMDVVVGALSSSSGGVQGVLQTWANQGGQFVATGTYMDGATAPTAVALADLDEDGAVDLISDTVFINNGAGIFFDRISGVSGSGELGVADLDRDGDLDLVYSTGGFAPTSVVFVNRHRHLGTPRVPVLGQPLTIEMAVQPGYSSGGQLAVPALASTPITPVSIPGLGILQLDPTIAVFGAIGVTDQDGNYETTLTVPNNTALAGAHLFWQGLVLEPAGLRLTGRVHDVVVR